jgi:hypothetical protein
VGGGAAETLPHLGVCLYSLSLVPCLCVCDEMKQWRLHTSECLPIKGKPKTTLVTI